MLAPASREDVPDVTWGHATDMGWLWKESLAEGGSPREALDAAVDRLLADRAVEPRITSAVVTSVADVPGAHLEGLAARVKSPTSMVRKIMQKAKHTGSYAEAAANLKDTIRYTAVADQHDNIVLVASKALSRLTEWGFVVESVESFYADGAPYKGLHATVRDSASATRFEYQFHSEGSLSVKEGAMDLATGLRRGGNHADYEYYREDTHHTTWEARVASSEAYDRCVERSRSLSVPAGLTGLETLCGCQVEHMPVAKGNWYVDLAGREDYIGM